MLTTVTLILAAAVLALLAVAMGWVLGWANRVFHVEVDPKIEAINDILPGANCGACGFAGCRAFAEGVVGGEIAPADCTVASDMDREDIAAFLGVDAGEAEKKAARLLCAGGSDVAVKSVSARANRPSRSSSSWISPPVRFGQVTLTPSERQRLNA